MLFISCVLVVLFCVLFVCSVFSVCSISQHYVFPNCIPKAQATEETAAEASVEACAEASAEPSAEDSARGFCRGFCLRNYNKRFFK